VAIALGQAGAPARADVLERGDLAQGVAEETQVFSQHPEADRLLADLAVQKSRISEITESGGPGQLPPV